VAAGDPVVSVRPTCRDSFVAFPLFTRAGAVPVPLDPLAGQAQHRPRPLRRRVPGRIGNSSVNPWTGRPPLVLLCLTGDVMCGRGVDQILPHPGDPTIYEPWVSSARCYVELAEERSGPIPRGVEPGYVWGGTLAVLEQVTPDAFIVNLETAVTDRGHPWPGKGIQYRMRPANVECLTVAGIDVAVLANNHVLDWSEPGLDQTLDVLQTAGITTVGAGRSIEEAWAPAIIDTPSGSRVLVLAAGSTSSGIPAEWAAGEGRPGVALLPDLSQCTVERIAAIVRSFAQPHDVVVVSLHWGGNWGYAIPEDRRWFAHQLIDRAGVHVVHGHSSHHPLGIEVYQGRLIVYGCGDLLTDYEGIPGHEQFRGDLGALFLATIGEDSGTLRRLELVPTKVERFQLTRPPADDARWLATTLHREGASLGTTVIARDDGRLVVDW
jgi:poly-gamma-glutamate synthesis protein (capsule biosynthesis protein)